LSAAGLCRSTKKIAGAGIPMTSTLAVFLPHFGADNTPLFRDGMPFPWNTISSAGQGPVNARLLWEAGISYGYYSTWSLAPSKIGPVDVHEIARLLGRRGGEARARRLSSSERRRIASLGGTARVRSLQAALRITDNLNYAAAAEELRGPSRRVLTRMKTFAGPLPGIYPDEE
jgi:hypothetical protein